MSFASLSALALYFLTMLGIGLYDSRRNGASNSAYLLGGRQLGPTVTALSAGASDMSAWLLMGLPGAVVVSGISSIWIAIGLLIGAWFNYLLLAPRLRLYTELCNDALTLPDYLARRFAEPRPLLRLTASLVIVVFFTLYTSSGLVAGGVLFENSFGLPYQLGLWLTFGVVVCYTMLGGFQAVCHTDVVQGCLMLAALLLVPLVAWLQLEDSDGISTILLETNPTYFNWFEGIGALAVLSSLAWGLGYFGQPHIVVRFMAIDSLRELGAARRIGMSWMILTLLGAVLTGMVGLAWMRLQGRPLDDPETIFLLLTQLLFNPFIGGVLLAAILAAIMSTVSSQLLVASSSLSEDFYRVFFNREAGEKEAVRVSRLAVALVGLVAVLLALDPRNSILGLVANAWAGFGAAFGPVLLASLYWPRMNWQGALAGMIGGAGVVILWISLPLGPDGSSLSNVLYEIIPGVCVSTLLIVVVSLMTGGAADPVREGFAHYEQRLQRENF